MNSISAQNSVTRLKHSFRPKSRASFAEGLFWFAAAFLILVWAAALAADLLPAFERSVEFQTFIAKHSGASALLISLLLLALISVVASLFAFRSKSIPQPSASVLLVTTSALRAVQILSEGSVTVADANILGAMWMAAAILYFGSARLWWLVLMPLATVAALTPLVWLEFFKGAGAKTLHGALLVPASAFLLGSLLITLREMRARTKQSSADLKRLRVRSQSAMRGLQTMEGEMKKLNTLLAKRQLTLVPPLKPVAVPEAVPVVAPVAAPVSESLIPVDDVAIVVASATTDFNSSLPDFSASEAVSFDQIDMAARHLLDEARSRVEGRPVRLNLTAPTGAGLPIAVRGQMTSIVAWMKSSILQSIDALGGFPNGVVRVTLKPALSSISISIEDNGRGMGELAQAKQGLIDGRMLMTDIRKEVEALGGRFDVQARLGVGARITIELPRVDAFANSPRASQSRTAMALTAPAASAFTGGSSPSGSNSPHA